MSQYLIIHDNHIYMPDAESYDAALDSLAEELQVNRDDLVLECRDLEIRRRQVELWRNNDRKSIHGSNA